MIRTFCALLLTVMVNIALAQSTAINEHFKALNSHDLKLIASQYTADAQVFSPNWEGAKMGADSIADAYRRYFKTSPDLVYTLNNTVVAGNTITVEYSWTGTMSDPEGGEPEYMKGKKYTLKACAIFVLKENKIIKETDYFDQVAFLRQVGFFDQNH